MSNTASLKQVYAERIAPALMKKFNYSSKMQIPVLKKIVINEGLGDATQDKKIIDKAIEELTAITGQKAVATLSKKDIANFKVRKKMPIGVRVTLRRERMYEFLEELIRVALPRIRDFKGIVKNLFWSNTILVCARADKKLYYLIRLISMFRPTSIILVQKPDILLESDRDKDF